MDLNHLHTYILLDTALFNGRAPHELARAALAGGATMLQIRAKTATPREFAALVSAILPLSREQGIPLIVNDSVEIALALGADGVHVGEHDLPVELVRRCFPHGIIGYSPSTADDLAPEADYLGIGPVFGTTTKTDAGASLGLPELERRVRLNHQPSVAIGGITLEQAARVRQTGVAGIVVGSAALCTTNITLAVQAFRTANSAVLEAL